MVFLEEVGVAVGVHITEGDPGVAEMVGEDVFIEDLSAAGADAAFFVLGKQQYPLGSAVAVGVFVVDRAQVIAPLPDRKHRWGGGRKRLHRLSQLGSISTVKIADLGAVGERNGGGFVQVVVADAGNPLVEILGEVAVGVAEGLR